MATSYNGWPASPDLATRPLVVAGESFSPGVRDHDGVFAVLRYVAEQMHARVEPIVRDDWHQADDWGFNFRPNRNDPDELSCHASGTAIDYNATRHPNGVPASATFTPAQIAEIRTILAEVDHVVAWGGDFNGTPDAMHFEIRGTEAEVNRVADRLREQEWFEMASKEDLREVVREELEALLKRELENGKTIQNNIRSAGDVKPIVLEIRAGLDGAAIAKALREYERRRGEA